MGAKEKFKAHLVNLADYKQEFERQGITIPLPSVPFYTDGLLAHLPPPPPNKIGWPWTVETQLPLNVKVDNSAWAKISIVIPSYNQAQFIEETIRSVLLQNYPNLELIVCDGGSTDGTQEILEKYSPWLSFWQSQKDRGQGHAINLGFSLASGDYFGWINSDDFYLPGCFQSVAKCFYESSADFIYGDALTLLEDEHSIKYWRSNFVSDRYLRFGGLIASHAAFWKSTIHQPIWEKMHCNVDGELWIRLLHGRRKKHLATPLGVYRVQPQAKTANEKYYPLWREDDENIAAVYGDPPQPRSFRTYEFVLIQRLYKLLGRDAVVRNMRSLFKECVWLGQYSPEAK